MLAKEILKKYVTRDAPHAIVRDGGAWQTVYQFPNGMKVSVVSGELFYTDESHPYELYITNSNDPDNDPYGYLDEFELLAKLVEVMEMEVADGIQK